MEKLKPRYYSVRHFTGKEWEYRPLPEPVDIPGKKYFWNPERESWDLWNRDMGKEKKTGSLEVTHCVSQGPNNLKKEEKLYKSYMEKNQHD